MTAVAPPPAAITPKGRPSRPQRPLLAKTPSPVPSDTEDSPVLAAPSSTTEGSLRWSRPTAMAQGQVVADGEAPPLRVSRQNRLQLRVGSGAPNTPGLPAGQESDFRRPWSAARSERSGAGALSPDAAEASSLLVVEQQPKPVKINRGWRGSPPSQQKAGSGEAQELVTDQDLTWLWEADEVLPGASSSSATAALVGSTALGQAISSSASYHGAAARWCHTPDAADAPCLESSSSSASAAERFRLDAFRRYVAEPIPGPVASIRPSSANTPQRAAYSSSAAPSVASASMNCGVVDDIDSSWPLAWEKLCQRAGCSSALGSSGDPSSSSVSSEALRNSLVACERHAEQEQKWHEARLSRVRERHDLDRAVQESELQALQGALLTSASQKDCISSCACSSSSSGCVEAGCRGRLTFVLEEDSAYCQARKELREALERHAVEERTIAAQSSQWERHLEDQRFQGQPPAQVSRKRPAELLDMTLTSVSSSVAASATASPTGVRGRTSVVPPQNRLAFENAAERLSTFLPRLLGGQLEFEELSENGLARRAIISATDDAEFLLIGAQRLAVATIQSVSPGRPERWPDCHWSERKVPVLTITAKIRGSNTDICLRAKDGATVEKTVDGLRMLQAVLRPSTVVGEVRTRGMA